MRHCDEEQLSLLALGEPGPAEVGRHLASCRSCTAELSALRQVVAAAREGGPGTTRVAPPAALWQRIAAQTGVEVSARHPEVLRHSQDVVAHDNAARNDATYDDAAQNGAGHHGLGRNGAGQDGTGLSYDDRFAGRTIPAPRAGIVRRSDRPGLLLAAACLVIGLLAGGLGTWLVTGERQPQSGASAPVVAATRLAGLALAPAAIGQADVVTTPTGRRLDLDVQKLGTPQGFYEVWLIDPTVTKMVPIGVLSGNKGRFALPAGVNLSSYPLLDISIQPLNGDPKHSGRSVLRGTFKT